MKQCTAGLASDSSGFQLIAFCSSMQLFQVSFHEDMNKLLRHYTALINHRFLKYTCVSCNWIYSQSTFLSSLKTSSFVRHELTCQTKMVSSMSSGLDSGSDAILRRVFDNTSFSTSFIPDSRAFKVICNMMQTFSFLF